jgi:adenylate cyclase
VADLLNSARRRSIAFYQANRKKAIGIACGVILSVGLGLFFIYASIGNSLVWKSYDIPFQWRPYITNTEQVVLVYLDDASHTNLNQKWLEPWDRAFYTRLLKRLKSDGAQAVVFDVVMTDHLNPATDQAFADAIRDNNNVILAADWVLGDYGTRGSADKQLHQPIQEFNEVAADIGLDTFFPGEDLAVRRYATVIHDPSLPEGQKFSEAWAAAKVINAPVTKDTNFSAFWINYYAPEVKLKSVSFYKALAENDPDVPKGFFSNKVVFVGQKLYTQNAAGRMDEYATPFSYITDDPFYAGVSIHATAFLNLLRGDWLRRFSFSTEVNLIALLGLLFGAGLTLCRPFPATLMTVIAILLVIGGDYLLFVNHYWFPWLIPVTIQIPVALVWSVAYNSVQIYVEKQKVEQSLSLFLPPRLVKKFASDPTLLKPGAKKQELTILFSDIAGFTTITEGMDPDTLAALMNAYFQISVDDCIHFTEGTIVKYIGDAIFAFWNAPDPQDDHAYRAAVAAIRFRDQDKHEFNGKKVLTRIGLHTGEANVGNFGSTTRVDYTAFGENINLSSRMEGLNKYLGTRILMTGETQSGIGDRLLSRRLGLFRLKGFEKAVQVYELIGPLEADAKTRELRQTFAEALDLFCKKEFAAAESAFRRVLKIAPEDGPSQFYLEQIEELRTEDLPDGWKGEIKLKDK